MERSKNCGIKAIFLLIGLVVGGIVAGVVTYKLTSTHQETDDSLSVTPQLAKAPVADAIGSSSIDISWNASYSGHGPVIGYIVNIMGGSWGANWSSVGYVMPTSPPYPMTFNVTGLQPGTDYDVMITLAHCHSALGVARGPVLHDVTTDSIETPQLVTAPVANAIGSSSVDISWNASYNGHGPVIGYIVNIRGGSWGANWSSVGYVMPTSPQSPITFTVTGLQPGTDYDFMISLNHCHCGVGVAQGPILHNVTTTNNSVEVPKLATAPIASAIGSSSIDISWNEAYNGQGPVTGYIVNIRGGTWGAHWSSVGYVVPTSPQSPMTFIVKGLQPGTDYDFMITLAHCHSGLGVAQGPVLHDVTTITDSVEPLRCPDPPQPRPCGSGAAGKHASVSLVLSFMWLAFTLTRLIHNI